MVHFYVLPMKKSKLLHIFVGLVPQTFDKEKKIETRRDACHINRLLKNARSRFAEEKSDIIALTSLGSVVYHRARITQYI